MLITKQGVTLMGRNTTGSPWSVSRTTAWVPGQPAHRQCCRWRRQTPASKTLLAH